MTLVAIWAEDTYGVIAVEDKTGLPWRCPEDLAHFKRETLGHVCIVGRTTFEGLPKLPGRRFVVLSSRLAVIGKNADTLLGICSTPAEAFALAQEHDQNPYCIGGKLTFDAMWQWVTHITRTIIRTEVVTNSSKLTMDSIDETKWTSHDDETLSDRAYVTKWFRNEAEVPEALIGDVQVSNSSLHDQIEAQDDELEVDLARCRIEDLIAEEHQPVLDEIVAQDLAEQDESDTLYQMTLKQRYFKLLIRHRRLLADPAVGSHLEPQLRALELLIHAGDD